MVNENSQAEKPEIEYDNLLDYFQYYLLPLAIRIGMTPKQFWEDDPEDFYSYWDAYEQARIDEARIANNNAYTQGYYTLLALQQVMQFTKSPKRIFPKKPLPLESDKRQQKREMTRDELSDIRKAQHMRLFKQLNGK